jgi:septum formation topological specificity factor MinE
MPTNTSFLRMNKSTAKKRLMEAKRKIAAVVAFQEGYIKTADANKLFKMQNDLINVIRKL